MSRTVLFLLTVDDVWCSGQQLCFSPVRAELRALPVCGKQYHRDRRVTRKYEAARRNGHFDKSPELLDESEKAVTLPGMNRI